MLFPKKVKHRKWQTSRRKRVSVASRGTTISFGAYGLKSMGAGRMNANQIEAARRVMRRALGKYGKVWTRVFPDRPYTAKAAEVGMGKGKGDLKGYMVIVEPGRILFEVDGASEAVSRDSLRKAGAKLPIKTRVVSRA